MRRKFQTGGTVGTDPIVGKPTGTESNISETFGPSITGMVGRAEALSETPYEVYQGPLTAGESELQTKAFQGLANLTLPTSTQTSYTPTSFTSSGISEKFMSPYLEAALNPQLEAARRQAEISRVARMGQLAKAGGFGGGRQAVLEGLLDENLQRQLAGITGAGYQKAFEAAQQQFNTEEDRQKAAAQLAQDYGLRALAAQQAGGATQRGIEAEGIAADLAEFEKQREDPYKKLAYLQNFFKGLPIEAKSTEYATPDMLSNIFGASGGLLEFLKALGMVPTGGTGK